MQLNLINQGGLLHEFVHKLERGLRAVEHNSAKLQQIRASLAADAADKVLNWVFGSWEGAHERVSSYVWPIDAG